MRLDHKGRLAWSFLGCLAFTGIGYSQLLPPSAVAGLKWRNIGPFRGGRVSALAGVVSQPDTFYIGLPQGGVWKTTSAGTVWTPIFDSVKDQCAIGSVAVAQSNPNVIYAGTGEISGGSSGNGAYRSSDGGKSWTKIGLEGTNVIPTLVVDPKDENLVLAAAVGSPFEANDKRGVYRSTDGGKTWTKTLNINTVSGVQHLAWAYDNPKVILATTSVRFYGQRPDAPGGKKERPAPELYKSTDGGATWTKLNPVGLPTLSGRITTAIAQNTNAQRIYLIGTFGLYRSDDGGQNWRKMATNDPRIMNGQGEYSSGVYVDSYDPDIVYTIATCMYRSTDGGVTFAGFKGAPGGDDPQQLWVDPVNRGHLLYGGDQGATVSLDSGQTWSSWYNQITAQVYHVVADNRFPYWVYATQQDSGTIATASAGALGQITQFDWYPHPGHEGGFLAPDPLNPFVVYGPGFYGGINRVSIPSYQSIQVDPDRLATETGFSSGQIQFSPANPHELLTSYEDMRSTTDGGVHWTKISPDLATDPTKKKEDQFAAIMGFSPSPLTAKVIWVRTSRNFIHVTSDHGRTWKNVTPPVASKAKPLSIHCVEASGTDSASAYAMVTDPNEKDAGMQTQFYRTKDFGATWQKSKGFSCSNLRSDPKKKGLIFAQGGDKVRFSTNDGEDWQDLDLNLPKTSYSDIQIHGNDLILGTFGRGIWILDDFSPLRQLAGGTPTATGLFQPSTAIRVRRDQNLDTPLPPEVPHAPNPPLGVCLYYSLSSKPTTEVSLDIFDSKGERVRHFSSLPPAPFNDPKREVADYWPAQPKPIPAEIGMNRINWDCRYDSPEALTNNSDDTMQAIPEETPIPVEGPLVAPGRFNALLHVNGETFSQSFEVANDPRSTVANNDLARVLEVQKGYLAGARESLEGYHQVDSLLGQLNKILAAHPVKEVADATSALVSKIQPLKGVPLNRRRAYGPPNPDSFGNLNIYLILQMDVFSYGDSPITDHILRTYGTDWAKLNKVTAAWSEAKKKDLSKLNSILQKNNLSPLTIPADLQEPTPPASKYLPPKEAPKPPVAAKKA